uniref:Glycogen synthase kinase-3 alpha (Trinotate prediction) n=1 Tax=Henneguya salminicola TaxID=69463 RepID=A0A6G3MFS5_HENSL
MKNGINLHHKKDFSSECLIPKCMFDGFYGELPDKPVNLFLTDVSQISEGTFGIVYRANLYVYSKRNDTEARVATTIPQRPQVVAVKLVQQDKRYKNRELEMTRIMTHPNIVQLKFYFKVFEKNLCYLCLIMEYLPINFFALTRHNLKHGILLSEQTLKSYAFQLISAMDYIHKQNICHRDIKPQNILINESRTILKVCDFGRYFYL